MSDVALVALFSACATVIVAALGVVSAVFGPLAVERMRRRISIREAGIAADKEIQARRLDRAVELSEALLKLATRSEWSKVVSATHAASAFIAVLGKGNEPTAQFVRELVEEVRTEPDALARLSAATKGMDRIFEWLRGDAEAPDFPPF